MLPIIKNTDKLNSKSGAVSVQAIFMMLVMVTLGAFAITSARVNYTFSMKALNWNRMYYALEDQAERYVKEVDAILKEAVNSKTEDYIGSVIYKLGDLYFMYPENTVELKDDGLFTGMNFVSDENEEANLKVTLKINGDINDPYRFTVYEWTQWQSVSGESDFLDLWDGTF